ncbi:MAG: hypothetical protein NT162_02775 [Candidatus Woesebacteria bacterium]|nr:hypothetical protein [Candidatus Woesebacteria bacterium]
MTENRVEIVEIDISQIEAEYDRWKNVEGVSTPNQVLHSAVLNNNPWGKETPKKIAEFILSKDRQEVLDWVDDRKGLFHLENDDNYKRVHEVVGEIKKILTREKENNSPLVEADLHQS